MWRFFVLSAFLSFSLSPSLLTSAEARDFTRGPLIVSLSSDWTVTEEPGPELLKATLGQTASLALWKYNSGIYSPEQFLSGLRNDLGWTLISEETIADPRFGRTHLGLYQKIGRFDEKPFTIRSCDFVLDGDIYVLVMSAPESQFKISDTEFRKVFEGLSNMSGAVRPLLRAPPDAVAAPPSRSEGMAFPRSPSAAAVDPVIQPIESFPPRSVQERSPEKPVRPTFHYDFIYELSDGSRLGFQSAQKTADVIDPNGSVRMSFSLSGVPYISQNGVYVLSDEYAYRLDPSTGNITSRSPLSEVLRSVPALSARNNRMPSEPLSKDGRSNPEIRSGDDSVKAIIQRAFEIRRQAGVKPAIDYMMAQRGNVEISGSVHLYEFYFRLGEYWEETGDLETALAYYRLATKAID